GLPILTRSAIPGGLTSAAVDATVSDLLRHGESLYVVEEETLAVLNPDLLITQELCDVCAVSYDDVCRISQWLPSQPQVVSLTPPDLNGIFADIATIAEAAGVPARGHALTANLQARLDRVVAQVHGGSRPRVFLLEWLDPPFAAGHWAPEMVALAGGQEVLGRAGEKSFRVTWQQVIDAAPEIILIAPCGYSQAAAEAEWARLPKPAGWETIPAVQQGRVYALDANSYCSRPAPRVVDGIERLAALLHPMLVSP
ncbi:MAG TPA: ABC transporter substrate-binding protein, partial [Caldilineaceae bacterium]|nr:ABC transporter substrate-binding protein [Caldilineaceae bacterium]